MIKENNTVQKSVLITLILKPDLFFECQGFSPEFFSPANQPLATELNQRIRNSQAVSFPIFKDFGLNEDDLRFVDSSNLRSHFEILKTNFIQAKSLQIATEAAKKIADGESYSSVWLWQEKEREKMTFLSDLSDKGSDIDEMFGRAESAFGNKDLLSGIHTGYRDLNYTTGGWQRGDLIILAARPSVGKTTQLQNFITGAARFGSPSLLISAEMSKRQLWMRFAADVAQISYQDIQNGRLTEEQLKHLKDAKEYLKELPIYVEYATNIEDIVLLSHTYKRKKGIELIGVDYLQLLSGYKGENKNVEIGNYSRRLKQLAGEKECDAPVICLSQLNRNSVNRGGTMRPNLSDLRDSGSIEQDADLVMFLHRLEVHNILEDADGNSTVGKAELLLQKHRNGALKDFDRLFQEPFTRFTEVY